MIHKFFLLFFRFVRWKSKSFYVSWDNRCLCQSIKRSGSEISERLAKFFFFLADFDVKEKEIRVCFGAFLSVCKEQFVIVGYLLFFFFTSLLEDVYKYLKYNKLCQGQEYLRWIKCVCVFQCFYFFFWQYAQQSSAEF